MVWYELKHQSLGQYIDSHTYSALLKKSEMAPTWKASGKFVENNFPASGSKFSTPILCSPSPCTTTDDVHFCIIYSKSFSFGEAKREKVQFDEAICATLYRCIYKWMYVSISYTAVIMSISAVAWTRISGDYFGELK